MNISINAINAILKEPASIRSMENPPDELMFLAISMKPLLATTLKQDVERWCFYALDLDPDIFPYIPREAMTEKLCLNAIGRDPSFLQFIPAEAQTDKVIFTALKEKAWTFWQIKKPTEEHAIYAVQLDHSMFCRLPEELKTKRVCYVACSGCMKNLRFCPDEWKQELLETQYEIGRGYGAF